jgi:hypothetical protein
MLVGMLRELSARFLMMRRLLVGALLAGVLTGCGGGVIPDLGDDEPPTRDECFDSVEALHRVFLLRFDQLREPASGEHQWWPKENWFTTIQRLYDLCNATYPQEGTGDGGE